MKFRNLLFQRWGKKRNYWENNEHITNKMLFEMSKTFI